MFQSEETVEDCIGRNVGPVLLEHLESINGMMKMRREKARKTQQDARFSEEATVSRENRQSRRMEKNWWYKYLGANMAEDYFFLKKLTTHPDVPSLNKELSPGIRNLAKECCRNLEKTKVNQFFNTTTNTFTALFEP